MADSDHEAVGRAFMWNQWMPIKVNFLVWRLNLDSLPTRVSLGKRGVNVLSLSCELCQDEEDSTDHVFASCRFSQRVWEGIARWCKLSPLFFYGVEDLVHYHEQTRGSKVWKQLIYSIFQATIWCIWASRNNAVFDRKRSSPDRLVEEVKVLSFLWVKHRSKATALGKIGARLM
ncbi:uncharacterized protein LOC110923971 [Helianthus annuus]|uniref:uncharacterized protein LOC110923971 n=1 Tax=Helianthus annuus TaxID=4232 RepID=UPI000B8F8465|nr:uncharacterized protein LOC110923971 [Helianthus annuus]